MAGKKDNRDAVIRVRVTKGEKSKFEKFADKRHTDLSEIVRQILHREAAQEVPR
jgi:hypothetical protein